MGCIQTIVARAPSEGRVNELRWSIVAAADGPTSQPVFSEARLPHQIRFLFVFVRSSLSLSYCGLLVHRTSSTLAVESMTEHSKMSSEEQAEFLTTQWMSVKQLEEAGKHGAAELQKWI
jgi:hypothetical protein